MLQNARRLDRALSRLSFEPAPTAPAADLSFLVRLAKPGPAVRARCLRRKLRSFPPDPGLVSALEKNRAFTPAPGPHKFGPGRDGGGVKKEMVLSMSPVVAGQSEASDGPRRWSPDRVSVTTCPQLHDAENKAPPPPTTKDFTNMFLSRSGLAISVPKTIKIAINSLARWSLGAEGSRPNYQFKTKLTE